MIVLLSYNNRNKQRSIHFAIVIKNGQLVSLIAVAIFVYVSDSNLIQHMHFFCCGSNILGVYRMKIRTVFKIQVHFDCFCVIDKGNSFNDACAVLWYSLYVGIQLRSRLTNRGFS